MKRGEAKEKDKRKKNQKKATKNPDRKTLEKSIRQPRQAQFCQSDEGSKSA
jgi:hypothetical protein